MKKKVRKHHPKENGAALIIAILVSVMMLLLAMPFLTKLSGQYRASENSYRSLAAVNLAEAGLERAIWELNYGDFTTWAGDSLQRTLALSSVQTPGGVVLGDIEIAVTDLSGNNPVIESTGQIDYLDDVTISKTTRIVLQKEGGTSLFDVGVFADESVTLASNLNIDGDVGTNGTHPGAISIATNSVITGDARCGPGGNPDVAIQLNGTAQVDGEQRAAEEAKELPPVVVPEGLMYLGDFYAKDEIVCISESGEYASFILDTGAVAEISGDVTLFVTGLFSLGSNTELRITEGGSLTLYLSGSMSLDSNCSVNNNLEDPTKLIILGTETFMGTVIFESNMPFYGAVYMPEADLVFSSNVQFNGSAIGNSIVLNSNVYVGYAEELQSVEGLPASNSLFIVKSWQERTN